MLIEHEQAIAHISHCDVDRRGESCRHIVSAGRKGCLEQALGHEKGESLLRRSVFSGLEHAEFFDRDHAVNVASSKPPKGVCTAGPVGSSGCT